MVLVSNTHGVWDCIHSGAFGSIQGGRIAGYHVHFYFVLVDSNKIVRAKPCPVPKSSFIVIFDIILVRRGFRLHMDINRRILLLSFFFAI